MNMTSNQNSNSNGFTANSDTYFQRLTIGDMYNRMFSIFRERMDVFLSLSALSYIPIGLFILVAFPLILTQIAMSGGGSSSSSNSDSSSYDWQQNEDSENRIVVEIILLSVTTWAAQMLLNVLGFAAMSYAVGQKYLQKPFDTIESFKHAWRRACTLFSTAFLTFFLVAIPAAILVVISFALLAAEGTKGLGYVLLLSSMAGIVYVEIKFMVIIPTIALEDKGVLDSIKRSWELSNDNFLDLFCYIFMFKLVSIIASSIFSNLVGGAGSSQSAMGLFLATVVPGLIIHPLEVILKTMLYLQLRIKNEGLNADVLNRDMMIMTAQAPESSSAINRHPNLVFPMDTTDSGGSYAPVVLVDDDKDTTKDAPLLKSDQEVV